MSLIFFKPLILTSKVIFHIMQKASLSEITVSSIKTEC